MNTGKVLDEAREKIAGIIIGHDSSLVTKPFEKADQILNLPVGEWVKCAWCDGRRTCPSTVGLVICPSCDGTGKLQSKTLKQLIEEARDA